MIPDPAQLPPVFIQRGGDPTVVRDELMYALTQYITRQPRSQQVAIGPSEIGHPCARRIGYKLLNQPEINPHIGWKAFIGTCFHDAGGEAALTAENADTGTQRYLTETTLRVGDLAGQPIYGHSDVYDRTTAGNIDWKLVGTTQLRDYRANGPGEQYRAQAHLYGRGWQLAGFPIDWVGIFFLPRADELHQAYWWHEPYNEQVALAALQRLEGIHLTTQILGAAGLAKLPTADAYCHRCPWFKYGSTDVDQGCPGDPNRVTSSTPALTFT